MAYTGRNNHPELWLRPSPGVSLQVLSAFIENRSITATPRFGARNGDHKKGYVPGDTATLLLLDEAGREHLRRSVRIESVVIRPLGEFTPEDLRRTFLFHTPEEVRNMLSYFEEREVKDAETATIVAFSYLPDPAAGNPL